MDMLSIAMLSGCVLIGPQDHVEWTFSISTSGENVLWTSPSQINPKGGHYELLYTIESARVMVSYIGIEFGPIDIYDLLPKDVINTWRDSDGPCPLDYGWIEVSAPEDQDPPAFAYDWIVEINAKGTATYRAENVFLGQYEYDLGFPFGFVTVNIESGTLDAILTLDVVSTPCYADIDGSGTVDVADLLEVIANWGYCLKCPADTNQDDEIDVTDLLAVVGAWGVCPQ